MMRGFFWGSEYFCFFGFLLIFAIASPAQDSQVRLTAEKLLAEGEGFYAKNTPDDREKAFPKFTEALKLFEQIGDDEGQIKSLVKLKDISFYRGNFRECISYSTRVLALARKVGNRNLEAQTIGNIGFYHYLLGENRKGLEFLKQSAEILKEIGEKQLEGLVSDNIGQIYYELGEIKIALEFFQISLKIRRETNDRKGEGITLSNLGYAFNEGGDKQKALEYYQQALAIISEAKDERNQGTILNNIADVYHSSGEFQKAFDYYRQSLEIRRRIGDQYGESMVLHNIGTLYADLGNYENALSFLNQSLKIRQEKGLRREEALSLNSIGGLYSKLKDVPKALEIFQKAFEVQKTLENKMGSARILNNIGRLYLNNKEEAKAIGHLEQSLKLAEELNYLEMIGENYLSLARCYEKLGKPQAAEENFNRALTIQREINMPFELADTLYYFARFDENRGRRDAAIEKIGEVLQIVENLRNSIASQNLQASFFAEQQKYYEFYISLLTAQHKRFPDKGFGALALRTSENALARSLLDSLGGNRREIRSSMPPELLEEERLLRQTINAKDFQRIEALRQKSNEKAAEFEKELAENLRKYEELQAKIHQANPQFASLNNPAPLDLKEIQTKVLDENSILLEYFVGEERSFLFLTAKDKLEIIELPKREIIEKDVRTAIENLKSRAAEIPNETPAQRTARLKKSDTDLEKNLLEISNKIILPVAEKIKNKRLLVVASGILQYLPFAALKNQNSFLIETNEIVNLPSASVVPFLQEMKRREKGAKNLISIFADPVFSAEDVRLKTVANQTSGVLREAVSLSPVLRSDFSRLRFSRTEAEAISSLSEANQRFVSLDFAANLQNATSENLRNSRIVHFATHGIVNSQFPELSSIVFSLVDEKGKPQEGFLRLQDVYNLRLNADLVVLSACETALGKEVKGEGIIGLTRGFMFAGASSVAASLWQVEDRATADLMKRFYQGMLRENLTPSNALRQAQISMLKEKNSAHPFYWAGFTLQGDWK